MFFLAGVSCLLVRDVYAGSGVRKWGLCRYVRVGCCGFVIVMGWLEIGRAVECRSRMQRRKLFLLG